MPYYSPAFVFIGRPGNLTDSNNLLILHKIVTFELSYSDLLIKKKKKIQSDQMNKLRVILKDCILFQVKNTFICIFLYKLGGEL